MAEQNVGVEPAAAATARSISSVTLPRFWSASPAGWFRSVEAQFMVRNVTSPLDRYYLVLAALNEEQVDKVMAVTEEEPTEESYERIKAALVSSHSLTPFQQVDRLVNMEGLNGRKPSELLSAMDKLKPKDANSFYAYHFLQRMPREVRLLLAKKDLSDMRALAAEADDLMALHQPQAHDAVAAVQPAAQAEATGEDDTVAAVGGRPAAKKKQKKKGGKKQRNRSSSPSIVEKSPLCWAHIRYGDKAYSCTKPCAWPEN
jgi:hypothetical protein